MSNLFVILSHCRRSPSTLIRAFGFVLAFSLCNTSSAELQSTTVFRVLTAPVETAIPEAVVIKELAKDGRLSANGKVAAGKIGVGKAFDWLSGKAETEFHDAIKSARAEVAALDPANRAQKQRLEELANIVSMLRKALTEIEIGLHSKADELLISSAILEGTSVSTFANFWFRQLPKARRSLASLADGISRKINTPAPKANAPEDTFKEAEKRTHTVSLSFAWQQVSRFTEYTTSRDRGHIEEAKRLREWSDAILFALPPNAERTPFEVGIEGAYRSLSNTLRNYVSS